jgi:tetratricopeptide (TPR) repeat protein
MLQLLMQTKRHADLVTAVQHHAAGRLDEAERCYMQLYRTDPGDSEVLYLLGILSCDLGLFDAAARFLDQAIGIAPAFPEAHRQRAVARKGVAQLKLASGDAVGAEHCLQQLLESDPNDGEALNLLGLAQLQQENFAAAAASLRRTLQMQPENNQACNNLGLALLRQGRLTEARSCFEDALNRDASYASARINLANTLRLLREPAVAQAELQTVLAAAPDSAEALNNLGAVAQDLGDTELALACLSRAHALRPDTPEIRWNLALTQLRMGEFALGWSNFESRWEGCENLRGEYVMPKDRAWHGEPLQGRRLLLWAEQGFGDTLQFIRFASELARRGALVDVIVPAELVVLARSVAGINRVTAQGSPLPDYDFHCPLMSLPHRLQLRLDSVALFGATPYLTAPPDRVAYWRSRMSGYPGLRVGLVWSGNSRRQSPELAAIDLRRSIPFDQLAPLLAVRGCSFFSLQKGAAAAQCVPAGVVRDFSHQWTDFAETAAFVACLDLVISVDTAVAHLAGALGKPVWLLNRYDSCWRWLSARRDSPWYATLRQLRQPELGNWKPVIAAAAFDLAEAVGRPAGAPISRAS